MARRAMTIDEIYKKLRSWDTSYLYHVLSFQHVDGSTLWTIEQFVHVSDDPHYWHWPNEIARGNSVASLKRFIAYTHEGERPLQLQRFNAYGVAKKHNIPLMQWRGRHDPNAQPFINKRKKPTTRH